MKILNRKINNIYKEFKTSVNKFTETLDIDNHIERIVLDNIQNLSNPKAYGDYFYPINGYYSRTFNIIIVQAGWHLRLELESRNCPPVKPKYQFIFRAYLHTHLNGLIIKAIELVEPMMKRFGMQTDPKGDMLDIKMDIIKLLYAQDEIINSTFTNLFNNYNISIRPFKDSIKSTIAVILSILAIILTIIINFRNELWNFFFLK